MTKRKIVVLGAAFVDMLFTGVPRLPGPDQSVYASDLQIKVGGKGFNQARAAAALGAEVTLIACTGDDAHGATVLQEMEQCGLNQSAMVCVPGAATPVCCVFVDHEKQIAFLGFHRACHAAMSIEHIEAQQSTISGADVLIATFDYPLPVVARALEIAKGAGVPSIVNPAPLTEPVSACAMDVSRNADLVVPNMREAGLLLNSAGRDMVHTPEALARGLVSEGLAKVCITHGDQGSVLLDQNETIVQPAFRITTDNAVGASDQLCGSLGYFLPGASSAQALLQATASVSLWLSRLDRMQPTRDEVVEYLMKVAGS